MGKESRACLLNIDRVLLSLQESSLVLRIICHRLNVAREQLTKHCRSSSCVYSCLDVQVKSLVLCVLCRLEAVELGRW